MENLQLAPGTLFADRFAIESQAGSGGMGTVYRARDRGGLVALKLLHGDAEGPADGERFGREATLLAELRHPGIVGHIAHGQTPAGQRYLAMEWLEGEDLGQRLLRGPLPLRDCVRLLARVTAALAVAHQRGIIHRDLKPTNLLLVGGDVEQVKILDFGIARRIATTQAMTQTGIVIGTPEYMAPEQARGVRELSAAADLFSLGCVLYECLAGQPPFVAEHITAVLVRILFEEPVPIAKLRRGVPADLVALLGRLLNKDPAQRPADATALHRELQDIGEVQESVLDAPLLDHKPPPPSFAENEQSLFSIVLAAPPEQSPLLRGAERQLLLQALHSLRVAAVFLASGALIVTVPATGSATDQATRAGRAALLIRDLWSAAIVSVATGRGTLRGVTAVGEVAEAAARTLKRGSQPPPAAQSSGPKIVTDVFIDALTAQLLAGRFVQLAQPDGALLLGEEREIDISRPLFGKPTPCVGRDVELGTLELHLANCIAESEAQVTLVTAAPGVGKSRLRHEFLRRWEKSREPLTLIQGRGDMIDAGAAYGVLRTALQNLCNVSGSEPLSLRQELVRARIGRNLAAADQERVILFIGELCAVPFPAAGQPMLHTARQEPKLMQDCLRRALLDFFTAECAVAPVLVVLDDLHWGDELTVAAVDEALRELAFAPLFVLAFARPEVHELFPGLWASHKLQKIALKGLSKKACERLIGQVLGTEVAAADIAQAVEHSAGNALFLEELIRSIAEGKSEQQCTTVLAMLQARLGRLDGNARRVVRAAAVFGQTFWRGGVVALLGQLPSEQDVERGLAVLVEAEVVQSHRRSRLGNQTEYGFRHALMRDAAYGLLTDTDLSRGHHLAAEFLQAAGETSAASIAEHFERGEDRRRAAHYYLQAAADSLEHGDIQGTVRQAARGISCSPVGETLGELYSLGIIGRYYLNRYEGVAAASALALPLLRPGSLGWCRALHGAIYTALTENRGLLFELLAQLLCTAPEPAAQNCYIETLGFICPGLLVVEPESIKMLRAVGDRLVSIVSSAAPDNPALLRYRYLHEGQQFSFVYPRPWSALLAYGEVIRLCGEWGDHKRGAAVRAIWMEYNWLELGDLEGSRQRMLGLEKDVTRIQEQVVVSFWRHNLAWILCEAGEERWWSQAESLANLLVADHSGMIYIPLIGQGILARVALLRGQLEAAEQLARGVMQLFLFVPHWLTRTAAVQLRALLALGRPAEAIEVAEKVLAAIGIIDGVGFFEVEFRLAASEAFAAALDLPRAHIELRETLRQIKLRADDITDPFWRNSYLTKNPYCVRAQVLGQEWGVA